MARFKVQTQNGCQEEVDGRFLASDRGLVLIFGDPGDSIIAVYAHPQEVRRLPDAQEQNS